LSAEGGGEKNGGDERKGKESSSGVHALILRAIGRWALDKRYTPERKGLGKGVVILICFDARNDSHKAKPF